MVDICGCCDGTIISVNKVTVHCNICNELKLLHIGCANQYMKVVFETNEIDLDSWGNSTKHPFYCKSCSEGCFFCRENKEKVIKIQVKELSII